MASSSFDTPPWVPNATIVLSGLNLISSTQAFFLPAFAAFIVPRTVNFSASNILQVPFLSPAAMYLPSDDQSRAVGSNANYSEHTIIFSEFQTLTVRSAPADANRSSVG